MNGVLPGIMRLEWRYQVRQLAFPVAALAFMGFALLLVATGFGPPNAQVNSPYVVMESVGLLTLPAIFLLTITCTSAALRDVEYRMAEIVWSSPAGRLRYLAGRFGGAMLAAFLVLALAILVLALAPHLVSVAPERLGPTRPVSYLWALALVGIPNILLFGSVTFAVAAFTRSTVASYVAGVFLYALYFITALLIDSPLMANAGPVTPEAMARAALLDPLGLSAFFEQTRYWGAAERNAKLLTLTGTLLFNRLLWLGITAAILALVARFFSFRLPAAGARRTKRIRLTLPFPRAGTAFTSSLGIATRLVLGNLAFAAIVALWVFVAGMEMWTSARHGEYFTAQYPTTGFLLNGSLQPLALFGTMVITWFAAELVWRDRSARIADIIDATPASSAMLYLARLGALVLLALALSGLTIVIGLAIQVVLGYTRFEPGLWLSLVPIAGIPLALSAVLVLLIQVLSPNRWVGLVLCLAAIIGLEELKHLPALSHPIFHYGAAPALEWSDMNGYGMSLVSWAWFMAAWSTFAIVLATATVAFWPRGRRTVRLHLPAAAPSSPRLRLAGLAALAAFGALAGSIWYRTTVLERYETSDALSLWKAGYERAWRRTAADPSPVITAITGRLDLHPSQQRHEFRGTAILTNATTAPVDTVRVVTRRGIRVDALGLAGARRVGFDSLYHVTTFALEHALAPGDSALLSFELAFEDAGLRADGYDNSVVPNGTFIMSHQVMPSIGYRSSYEVQSPARRRELGLPAASAIAPLDTTGLSRAARGESWTRLDLTISTDGDQQVVASGAMAPARREDGRNVYRFVTGQPVTGRFAIASARYAVRRARAGEIDVELYYHPRHEANADAMLESATRSLGYFGRAFGPYPHRTLRIAEVPSYLGAGALAMPGTIYFVEDRGFMTDARDSTRFDIITRRMAHEVAHQWWGHQLSPADAEGAAMLVETLAKYSEQLVLRARRGEKALEPLLYVDEDRYRAGAAEDLEDEPGLYRVADQEYIYYGKGGVVMHQLTDSLGEAALNRSLRTLVDRFGGPDAPPATTLDLLDILHADMPVGKHPFIDRSLREAGLLK